jgi:hypothetical protein
MTLQEKIDLLKQNGWHTWYNENYWVHTKTVVNPKVQDYTNYGMSLEAAYEFETQDKKSYKPWTEQLYNLMCGKNEHKSP